MDSKTVKEFYKKYDLDLPDEMICGHCGQKTPVHDFNIEKNLCSYCLNKLTD